YTGATTVAGGTVQIGAANNLGAAASTLAFAGGTLHTTHSMDLHKTVTLNGAGGTLDTDVNNVSFSGVVSGSSSLTKVGSGNLFVTNTNTYSGATNING